MLNQISIAIAVLGLWQSSAGAVITGYKKVLTSDTATAGSDVIQYLKAKSKATAAVPIIDSENFSLAEESIDDYVIKFKSRLEPLSLREAIEAQLIPQRGPNTTINELLMAAHDDIEDILPLKLILAVLRSPDNEAIPMLLADFKNDNHIFTVDQIQNPKKLTHQNLAQIYDLRRFFIDVYNEGEPQEKATISLATALLEELVPFVDVADLLLNKLMFCESIIFTLRKNNMMALRNGQLVARIDAGPVSVVNEYQVSGAGTWINTRAATGGIMIQPVMFSRLAGTLANLSASFELFSRTVPGYSNIGSSFYMDTQGASLTGNISSGIGTLMPWYGYSTNWNGFGLNGKMNITNVDLLQALTGGAFLSVGSSSLGFGVGGTVTTDHGSITGALQYSRSKNREVVVSRPQVKFRKDSLYRISVSDSAGRGAQVNLAAREPITGLGGVIMTSINKSTATTYRTNVPKAVALRYIADGHRSGLSHLGQQFMVADLPDVRNPLLWKEGDEYVTTKTGSYTGAFIVGFSKVVPIQVQAGANMEVRGCYELQVKRLKNSKVEVSVSPTRLEEFGVFARVMNFAGITATHGLALALKQKFVFDFAGGEESDSFGVQTAYRRLVDHGILPNELSNRLNIIEQNAHPGQIIEHFALENRCLKTKGIERHTIEISILQHSRLAALVGLNILGVKFYEVEHIRAAGNRVVATTDAAVESKICESRKNKTKLHSGQLRKKAFATVNVIWENPEPGKYLEEFNNIVLTAEITDTKITGKDNNRIRTELNNTFNMDFEAFTFPAQRESRTVILERKLSTDDLVALRETAHSDMAILHSAVNPSDINQFIGSIRNQGPGSIAEKVREFVGDHGLNGIGAIHYLLGGRVQDMKVRTTSSVYTGPLKRADDFIIKWSKESEVTNGAAKAHIKTNFPRTAIQDYFQVGEAILADLKIANAALDDDKFMISADDKRPWPVGMRETKISIRNQIQEAYASIHKLLSLSDLADNERATIFQKVVNLKRSLLQRAVIHDNMFSHPIQAGDERSELRRRFKESDLILKQAKVMRAELSIMTVVSDEDRKELLAELDAAEAQAQRVISLDRLRNADDYDTLVRTLHRSSFIPLPIIHRHRAQERSFQDWILAAKEPFLLKERERQAAERERELEEVATPILQKTELLSTPIIQMLPMIQMMKKIEEPTRTGPRVLVPPSYADACQLFTPINQQND